MFAIAHPIGRAAQIPAKSGLTPALSRNGEAGEFSRQTSPVA